MFRAAGVHHAEQKPYQPQRQDFLSLRERHHIDFISGLTLVPEHAASMSARRPGCAVRALRAVARNLLCLNGDGVYRVQCAPTDLYTHTGWGARLAISEKRLKYCTKKPLDYIRGFLLYATAPR